MNTQQPAGQVAAAHQRRWPPPLLFRVYTAYETTTSSCRATVAWVDYVGYLSQRGAAVGALRELVISSAGW